MLGIALTAAAFFAVIVIVMMAPGGRRDYILVYYVPIGVPFVAWLFERFERRAEMKRARLLIDLPILVLSLTRAVNYTYLLYISGHALFLTYAFVTSRTVVVRVTTAVVMIEVVYFKVEIQRDPSLLGGIVLGVLAGLLFHALRPQFNSLEPEGRSEP